MARSHNRCRLEKALSLSIIYPECVSVALVIQHATRMRHYDIVVCGLSGPIVLFYIIS
jgi:hypothetical protein